jgi:hypothetical protein
VQKRINKGINILDGAACSLANRLLQTKNSLKGRLPVSLYPADQHDLQSSRFQSDVNSFVAQDKSKKSKKGGKFT